MKLSRTTAVAALLLAGVVSATQAETIEQSEAWATQEAYMSDSLANYTAQCGASIEFRFDKDSWWRAHDTWGTSSPYGLCSEVVDTVARACGGSAAAKAAVSTKIKSMQCGHGKFSTSLVGGGGFRVTIDGDAVNPHEQITDFIKQNL